MDISVELVRRFFLQRRQWAVPVGLILLILCALVAVTDFPVVVGPLAYAAG